MQILTPGHRYLINNFDQTEPPAQTIQFIQKESLDPVNPRLSTIVNGTTNEEVLRVLIDRMQFLQGKFPCRENSIVITKLEESLMWLEKRTADRQARKVEGTNQK